jgi:hypothetical protein
MDYHEQFRLARQLPPHTHDDRYYTESEVDSLISGVSTGTTATYAANAAEAISAGEAVYLNASGEWALADASDEAKSGPVMLGIATATVASGDSLDARTDGAYTTTGLTAGDIYYLDPTTPGGITNADPNTFSTGSIVRPIGYATSSTELMVSPGPSWVSISAVSSDGTITWGIAVSDEDTDLTTGTGKVALDMPMDFVLTRVYATTTTAATGAPLVLDVNAVGSTLLDSDLTFVDGETNAETSTFAGASPTHVLSKGDRLTIDIVQIGTSAAGAGLKVFFSGRANGAGHREVIQVPITSPGGTLTSGDVFVFDYPYSGTVERFEIKAQTAPTSSAATFDLQMVSTWGGTLATQLSSDLSLAAGSNSGSVTTFAVDTVTGGSVGAVKITGVDAGGTCADAVACIHFLRD